MSEFMYRKRSSLWQYFVPVSSDQARCMICQAVLSFKGGSISNLNKHVKARHGLTLTLSNGCNNSAPEESELISLESSAEDFVSPSIAEQDSCLVPAKKISGRYKKRSSIWHHFTSLSDTRARCDICETEISFKGGSTSNLLKHLRVQHKWLSDNVNSTPDSNEAQAEPTDQSSNHAQLTTEQKPATAQKFNSNFGDLRLENLIGLSACGRNLEESDVIKCKRLKVGRDSLERCVKTEAFSERQTVADEDSIGCSMNNDVGLDRYNRLDELLLRMIVVDFQPFSIVEDDGFQNFVRALDPCYCLPNKPTITQDLIPSAYDCTLRRVKALIRSAEAVTITANTWTACGTCRYLSVMASYVTTEFTRDVLMLECCSVGDKLSAQKLSSTLQRIMHTWDLQGKTQAVVTDTTYSIKEAVELIGQNHLSCLVHTLNDLIEAAMISIQPLQKKVESICEFFHVNVVGAEKLQSLQNQMRPDDDIVKLKAHCDGKWNSVCNMFRQLCSIKEAVTAATADLHNSTHQLDSGEWATLEEICSAFVLFESVLKEVLLDKALSASKLIPIVHGLDSACRKIKGTVKTYTSQCMLDIILKKLNDTFSGCEDNVTLACATFLDPRFKRLGFNSDDAFMRVKENITLEVSSMCDSERKNHNTQGSAGFKNPGTSSEADASLIWEEFDKQVSSVSNSMSSSLLEVQQYIDEANLGRGEDALTWWKERANVYPRLAKLACKYLCIVTTIPNKTVMSLTNKNSFERRSRYSSKYLPTISFLGANFDA